MDISYGYAGYETFTDEEWVDKLLVTPPIQTIHRYFFKEKCSGFLRYIAKHILKVDSVDEILGEFYQFISADNWRVLRMYRRQSEASLYTYLSRCTVRYFLKAKKRDCLSASVSLDSGDVDHSSFVVEEADDAMLLSVRKAFGRLNERDRILLRALIVDKRPAIEVANDVWHYVRSREADWRKLSVKRVQSTISMMKKRAECVLLAEFKKTI